MATILIVDGHQSSRDFLAVLLAFHGHRSIPIANAPDALAVARTERPDLIITDVLVPGLDGREFVRRLRADPASAVTRILFTTPRHLESEARALARTCGLADVLHRPCDPAAVLRAVATSLAPARSEPPPNPSPPLPPVADSESLFRGVVGGALQGILLHQDGRIRYANATTARMFGYDDPADLTGLAWSALIVPDELPLLRAQVEACLRGEPAPPHPGWQGVRRDGVRIWLESIIDRITWQGRPAVLVFLIDITERKRLETQFLQAQKMEAVGRLAGGVAHDFNNLLTVITGFSELLLRELGPSDPLRGYAEEVRRAGERGAGLTRQLLAFSRRQVLVPVVMDVNARLADVVRMLTRLIGEDIDFTLVPDPGVWKVKADPGQFEQVVMNLVVNARDAMPDGGKLTVETTNVELDETYAAAHTGVRPGEYVRITVTDTGCGMTDDIKARVFEPFYTTKGPDKGTGLGLATVYGIIKQSGGRVEVYSEPGVGSTFKVYLPRAVEDAADAKPAGPRVRPGRGTETVLLVEDEDGVRALARVVLERNGYTVLEASTGEQALEIGERHGGEIHLLVTDLVMPDMTGSGLTRRLATLRPDIRVLCLSGYADDAVVRHGILNAETPFLQKPFTPDALAGKVREVLG